MTFTTEALQTGEPPPVSDPRSSQPVGPGLSTGGRTVRIELGRRWLPVETAMELGSGSILALSAGVDEAVEVYVDGTLAARGELLDVDGRLVVRIGQMAEWAGEASGRQGAAAGDG